MSRKSSNLLKSRMFKQMEFPKKPDTPNSLYSGTSGAQRAIRQQRYFGSASIWHSAQSTRGHEPPSTIAIENTPPPQIYHPWNSEYNKIITRQKIVKPMTKDPYTAIERFISHAVERVTTEAECCPPLIPTESIKIQTVNVHQTPRPSLPRIIHYLRRDELMPSERLVPPSAPRKISLISQTQYRKPSISVSNISKITGIAPTLVTTNRSLNRAKIRTDPSVIRRPPRKLKLDVSQETIMPLSVYG